MDSSWTDGEDEEEKQEEEMHFVKQLNRLVLPKSVFIYRRDTKQEPSKRQVLLLEENTNNRCFPQKTLLSF